MGCGGSKSTDKSDSTKKVEGKSEKDGEPGTVDGEYKIGDVLGNGAFSVVKAATNKKTGEQVAIKFIDKEKVEEPDLALLQREIDIMKKVHHENILKLKAVFDTKNQIAIVMELVNGGELFYKIVEKGNYSEADASNIVRQMVNGVAYLHSQDIAHRDLKPENLLCSSDERKEFQPFRVVIADFGLSKNFDEKNPLETACGTPDYVAPEVITAETNYDKSVDIWSCGVVTYVLLCGFSPFNAVNQQGLFEKIIKCEYDFPAPEWTNISEDAKDFIRHLLVKDPNQRYTAQKCLEHPWLNGKANNEVLASGNIGNKMKDYNENRKASQKNINQQ